MDALSKKSILMIAPILPQQRDLENIAKTLAFLEPHYHLDAIDPLDTIDRRLPNKAYYQAWQEKIANWRHQYQAFIGFSFGGVILQQCFSLFESHPCPVILFSTPTFADRSLQQKLGLVIDYCEKGQVSDALRTLYADVYYPNTKHPKIEEPQNPTETAQRLINGLTRVLSTDSTAIVENTPFRHLHLIGESSHLVNGQNVLPPHAGDLIIVPGAGMRVLEDKPDFCQQLILERFHHDIK